MASKKTQKISRWVRYHQGKHLCQCGCGEYIVVTRQHYKPSCGIPKFCPGHNLKLDPDEPLPVVEEKESVWDRLSPEEKERRIGQLKSFGTGEDNPSWKGGRRVDDHGYVQIRLPEHPRQRDGYVYQHRLVVEERTRKEDPNNPCLVEIAGEKYLPSNVIVHHIDEVKTNNVSSNLMLLPDQRCHHYIHFSKLPMEERLFRIAKGILHDNPLTEEESSGPFVNYWITSYFEEKEKK